MVWAAEFRSVISMPKGGKLYRSWQRAAALRPRYVQRQWRHPLQRQRWRRGKQQFRAAKLPALKNALYDVATVKDAQTNKTRSVSVTLAPARAMSR